MNDIQDNMLPSTLTPECNYWAYGLKEGEVRQLQVRDPSEKRGKQKGKWKIITVECIYNTFPSLPLKPCIYVLCWMETI